MAIKTILLIILSLVIAGGFSFYQYYYKNKNRNSIHKLLAALRFVSIFLILLLLINPILTDKSYEINKPILPIIVDNSLSISHLKQQETTKQIVKQLTENKELQNKFDIQLFSFDSDLRFEKPLDFKGKQTNIHQIAKSMKQLYRDQNYPTVLLTDGNQTIGNDYVFSFPDSKPIYPIVLGDTTNFVDIKINQLNVNKYAFLKNKFPVEVFLQTNRKKSEQVTFSILKGNSVVHKEILHFTKDNQSMQQTVLLTAENVGIQEYKAVVSTDIKEKNKFNNSKRFVVEVIDQRTEVAIISATSHPDLGALKRAIETNAQRKVSLLKPNDVKSLQDYNILIYYQPTNAFKTIFDLNKNISLNTFFITGLNTDYNFLNRNQNEVRFEMTNLKEDFTGEFDNQFNLFASEDIGFEDFPPLENSFGKIGFEDKYSVLLGAKIRNIKTENPLLVFKEKGSKRSAFLFGENIWKWRVSNHVETKSFEKFDLFIDKIMQYLATNTAKKSLIVNHERFYNEGENIEINAQFFNKNYELDENALLTIKLKNKESKQTKIYDFLKGVGTYKVNIDDLEEGMYNLEVRENQSNTVYTSTFEVLDFEIEKQAINPDLARLNQLVVNTKGKLFYPSQTNQLISQLIQQDSFKNIQKESINKKPLIDFIHLLVLLAITLSLEWFIRKYYGML